MIYSLAINRDGSLLATTSKDRKLRIIEPRTAIVVAVRMNLLWLQWCLPHIKFPNLIPGGNLSLKFEMFEGNIFRQWQSVDDRIFTTFRSTICYLGSAWFEETVSIGGDGQFQWCSNSVLWLRYESCKSCHYALVINQMSDRPSMNSFSSIWLEKVMETYDTMKLSRSNHTSTIWINFYLVSHK